MKRYPKPVLVRFRAEEHAWLEGLRGDGQRTVTEVVRRLVEGVRAEREARVSGRAA